MKSCLNFIFNSKESEIYEQIRELGGKILKSKDFKNAKASINNKNIKILKFIILMLQVLESQQ